VRAKLVSIFTAWCRPIESGEVRLLCRTTSG